MGDFNQMLGMGGGAASVGQAAIQLKMARDQKKLASTAMSEQKQAQDAALAAARNTARKADEAYAKANQKSPDIAALLIAEQAAAKSGVGGTMLTGAGGVASDRLRLGRVSLLGE